MERKGGKEWGYEREGRRLATHNTALESDVTADLRMLVLLDCQLLTSFLLCHTPLVSPSPLLSTSPRSPPLPISTPPFSLLQTGIQGDLAFLVSAAEEEGSAFVSASEFLALPSRETADKASMVEATALRWVLMIFSARRVAMRVVWAEATFSCGQPLRICLIFLPSSLTLSAQIHGEDVGVRRYVVGEGGRGWEVR